MLFSDSQQHFLIMYFNVYSTLSLKDSESIYKSMALILIYLNRIKTQVPQLPLFGPQSFDSLPLLPPYCIHCNRQVLSVKKL